MQDSTVKITITAVDGATKVFTGVGDTAVRQAQRAAAAFQKINDVTNVAIESTGKLGKAADNAGKAQDRLNASTRRSYFAQTALTTVLSAGVNQAFLQMVDVTGQAIQRVDLLSQFPASMSALGLSAADASVSLGKLADYVGSIGGNLQQATISVTRFAEVTKNVKAATAEFVGVNNALIAGGAPAQVQANALEQLTQAYSRGIPQLIEWRSLMVAMPAQLNTVAKSMGFVNANALGEALTNGKVSMQAFLVELTKLSTTGGPILTQAEARMTGIQFAFNRFKNTMVQGMTEVIQTIGRQNIINFFGLLTSTVIILAQWAVKLIGIFFSLFNIISRVFGGPQLHLVKDDTSNIADNLGTGADNAGDLADGLDDASKAAKKTANQLASFDKMNVLNPPADTSGKDKKPSAAGAPLSAADAALLDGIYDKIGGKLPAITESAKILAGVLASLAGIKFAQGLLNQFNGLVKTIEDAAGNIDKFKKKLTGTDEKPGLFEKAKKGAEGFIDTLKNLGIFLAGVFTNPKFTAVASKLGKVLFAPLIAAAGAVLDVFFGLAVAIGVALGVPLEVAIGIIVAAIAVVVGIIYLIVKNWDTIMNAVKVAAQAVWDFLVAGWNGFVDVLTTIWNKLYDIFAAPIKWLLNFSEGIFIAIVAIVAIFIQAVVGLFVLLVKGMYEILSAVAGWIYDNVITPIVNFFTAMWNAIVGVFRVAISIVFNNILLPIATWINVNVIQPIFNLFKALWDAVSGFVSSFFGNVRNFLSPVVSWIYNNVIVPIGNFFSGLWNSIKNGLSGMIDGFTSLLSGIGNIFKTPLNGIIDLLNKAIAGINKLKVPDWVPSLGGKSPGIQPIPKLARGGVLTQRTMIEAGENGDEAIVPLENNTEWIDKLAAKINAANGNGGQPIQLVVQIGEDKVASKIIDLINEKTQMSGRNTIFV